MMRCPYCAEDVKDEAVVCKHCHSELFVVKPLLHKVNEMSARLSALGDGGAHGETGALRHATKRHHGPSLTILESLALSYIGLMVAHALLILARTDAKLLYFHVASIGIPLIFGLLCRESEKSNLLPELLGGIITAIAAIFSMHAAVTIMDKVPLFPKDFYEWREDAIYSASIAFGFLTGAILRHMLIAIYVPNARPNVVIEWIARFLVEQFSDGKPRFTLKAIRSLVSSVLGFGSAIISIVTGMWQFLS